MSPPRPERMAAGSPRRFLAPFLACNVPDRDPTSTFSCSRVLCWIRFDDVNKLIIFIPFQDPKIVVN